MISHDLALTLIATAATTVWTAFKSSDWYARRRSQRARRALLILEAGVDHAWRTYVQALKDARAGGRLTAAEQRRAREIARQRALATADREGLDLVRELGGDFVDLTIAKIVKRLKKRTA